VAGVQTGSLQQVLVTGGNGFLGGAIVRRLLEQEVAVRSLQRSAAPELEALGVEVVRGDLADPKVVERATAGCEAVFHVAAKAGVWGRREDFWAANVRGTENVLAAAQAAGVRWLVHTSTPSVVFSGAPLAGVDERQPLGTRFPAHYPESKAIAERAVLAADGVGGLRTVALRPHLIWGVGDPHLVPRIVARARAGKLRIVGDGSNRVDLTHVDNAAAGHLAALAALQEGHAGGSAYFLSDGAPVVLWEWINALLQRCGIRPVTRRVPVGAAWLAGALAEGFWHLGRRSGEPPMTRFVAVELAKDHWFDITAARTELGYVPAVDLEAAMAQLVDSLQAVLPRAQS